MCSSASPSMATPEAGDTEAAATMATVGSSTVKPSSARISACSARPISMPTRLATREGRSGYVRAVSGTAPAITTRDGSPPQMSRIMAVPRSTPAGVKAGSTPRSNR